MYKVAGINSLPRLKSGTKVDRPTRGDSWWTCTTKCYAAKAACESDPLCDFIKDMKDLAGGSSTINIAAACIINCVSF